MSWGLKKNVDTKDYAAVKGSLNSALTLVDQIGRATFDFHSATGDVDPVRIVVEHFKQFAQRFTAASLDIGLGIQATAAPDLVSDTERMLVATSREIDREGALLRASRDLEGHSPTARRIVVWVTAVDRIIDEVIANAYRYRDANPKVKDAKLSDRLARIEELLDEMREGLQELLPEASV